MTTKEFAEQFDMSEVFILKLKDNYLRMSMREEKGLSQDEYREHIQFCERFTNSIISQLHITDDNLLNP